jgi:hypothetical protein
MFPAVQGPYFVALNQKGRTISIDVRLPGHDRPVVTLPSVAGASTLINWESGEAPHLDHHVFLVPDAKLLAILSISRDTLLLTKIDVDGALDKSGIDYLLVTSRAPTKYVPGSAFRYPVTVRSKKGDVKMKLDSGPDGMKLSADGQLEWSVPATFDAAEVAVKIAVSDSSGQQVFHKLRLAKDNRK